jgi:ATP-binding cassette subfamily B protein
LLRTFRLGYRAEPRLLALSLGLALLMMLPDALLALWLRFLVNAVVDGRGTDVKLAAMVLAASAVATWYLSILSQRVQRRFRDRIAIALESHVAHLQASVPTSSTRSAEYLDRLAMLRDQVFALDHMFMSLFLPSGGSSGWQSQPFCWRRSTRSSSR